MITGVCRICFGHRCCHVWHRLLFPRWTDCWSQMGGSLRLAAPAWEVLVPPHQPPSPTALNTLCGRINVACSCGLWVPALRCSMSAQWCGGHEQTPWPPSSGLQSETRGGLVLRTFCQVHWLLLRCSLLQFQSPTQLAKSGSSEPGRAHMATAVPASLLASSGPSQEPASQGDAWCRRALAPCRSCWKVGMDSSPP